jgi:hypothetical protein
MLHYPSVNATLPISECYIMFISYVNTFMSVYINYYHNVGFFGLVWFMVFNATFNNISVISWRSVLLLEESGGPWENHRPVGSHWQIWSQNVVWLLWWRHMLQLVITLLDETFVFFYMKPNRMWNLNRSILYIKSIYNSLLVNSQNGTNIKTFINDKDFVCYIMLNSYHSYR